MNATYLSIIIPCYNEEKRIGPTLQAIAAYLSKQPYTSEVIVVDNGSRDNTKEVVESYKKYFSNLNLIERRSHGKGYAVREGMLKACGEWRLFTDADNSTDISQVADLLKFIDEGYDVIISSRKAPGATILNPQPWYRVILGNIFQGIVGLIVPVGVKDTQNGFKLFSKEATEKIFPHQAVFYWAFDVEVLALARRFGFKIKEVPIVWHNDDRSTMSLKGMVRMLAEVTLTRLYLITRMYEK
jgi:dolichyl-phosphate beta-glucosyltransferase